MFRSVPTVCLSVSLLAAFGCKKAEDDPGKSGACTVNDPECVDWQYITDDDGRALILHGLNVDGNAKGDGLPSITREEVLQLSGEYGFNHARYLIFWSQTEPEQGVYDEAYLDEVQTRLDWLEEAGMKVVIDMHQDCWGDTIYQLADGSDEPSGANGAPMWATVTDGEPHTQPPGMWSLCYVSDDVTRAFDNFWDHEGHPELQDGYAAMWAHVVQRFSDHPAVIGYDIMNEPWEGSAIVDQQAFDEGLFHDFHQRVIDAIRTVDPDGWVFYEPRAFGPNQAQPSWLPPLNDPRDGVPKLAYYPHFYPVAYETGYDPDDDSYIGQWQGHRTDEQAEHRVPMVVGEYSTLPFDSEADRATYFSRMNAMLDESTSGWAFWDRGVVYNTQDGGELEVLDYLIRPYPLAVAGQPISYGFDRETAVFTLALEGRDKVGGDTEIFVPEASYPDGFEVEEGEFTSSFDEATRVLTVEADGDSVTVTIRP